MTNQTREIRQALTLKSANSKRSRLDWTFVTDLQDRLTYDARRACYGVEWAVKTGRLTAAAETAIRRMNAWQFSGLVGEIVTNAIVQNDVPRWLNGRFV